MVGVSRNPKDFTRTLFRELCERGYDVVPVNPNATEMDGVPCFPHVQDVAPGVDGALLVTNAAVSEEAVRECSAAGVRRIWLHRGGGSGAVSQGAVDFCEANGMAVVAGECPFMFLPDTGMVHRFHGFCRKLIGRYPK